MGSTHPSLFSHAPRNLLSLLHLPGEPLVVEESNAKRIRIAFDILEQMMTRIEDHETLVLITARTNNLVKTVPYIAKVIALKLKAELTAELDALKGMLACVAELTAREAEVIALKADLTAKLDALKGMLTAERDKQAKLLKNLRRNPELRETMKVRKAELARVKAKKRAASLSPMDSVGGFQ